MRRLSARLFTRLSIVFLTCALGASSLGCGDGGGPTEQPIPGHRLLFVGNSLTYANDLPGMVRALAAAAALPALEAETVAFPSFNLDDHRARGDAGRAIARGGWTLVVLQQGPSSLEENRAQLREAVGRFDADVRPTGARTALYMVWPALENAATFDRAVESYRLAAEDVHGVLFPVGEAFRAARARDPQAPLYEGDGFHPTPTGSYLAALVIVGRLYERTPVGLPRQIGAGSAALTIPPALAATLQAAAAEALARFPNP